MPAESTITASSSPCANADLVVVHEVPHCPGRSAGSRSRPSATNTPRLADTRSGHVASRSLQPRKTGVPSKAADCLQVVPGGPMAPPLKTTRPPKRRGVTDRELRHEAAPCEKPSSTMRERRMPAPSTRATSGVEHREARRDARLVARDIGHEAVRIPGAFGCGRREIGQVRSIRVVSPGRGCSPVRRCGRGP